MCVCVIITSVPVINYLYGRLYLPIMTDVHIVDNVTDLFINTIESTSHYRFAIIFSGHYTQPSILFIIFVRLRVSWSIGSTIE